MGVLCWFVWLVAALLAAPSHAYLNISMSTSGYQAFSGRLLVGLGHTCVLSELGVVSCVGGFSSGFAAAPWYLPAALLSPPTIVMYGVGYYGDCALTSDGMTTCWDAGWFSFGGQPGMLSIAHGGDPFCCGITATGAAVCWGTWAPGNGPGSNQVAVFAGLYHACSISSTGVVSCWGGRNGEGSVPAAAASNARSLAMFQQTTCVLLRSMEVTCFAGSLCATSDLAPPSSVQGNAVYVTAGMCGGCAVLRNTSVICWGSGVAPVPDWATAGVVGIVGTQGYACAVLASTGGPRCWTADPAYVTQLPTGGIFSGIVAGLLGSPQPPMTPAVSGSLTSSSSETSTSSSSATGTSSLSASCSASSSQTPSSTRTPSQTPVGRTVCDSIDFSQGSFVAGVYGNFVASPAALVAIVNSSLDSFGVALLPQRGFYMMELTSGEQDMYTTLTYSLLAPASSRLTCNVRWVGMDAMPFNDHAQIVDVWLSSAGGDVTTTLMSVNISSIGDYLSSPWVPVDVNLTRSGQHSLVFRVANNGDSLSQQLPFARR